MKMTNRTYDILKELCTKWIPAIIVFVTTVLGLVNLDGHIVALVTGILGAVDTLIGSLIGVSTQNYWKDNENG